MSNNNKRYNINLDDRKKYLLDKLCGDECTITNKELKELCSYYAGAIPKEANIKDHLGFWASTIEWGNTMNDEEDEKNIIDNQKLLEEYGSYLKISTTKLNKKIDSQIINKALDIINEYFKIFIYGTVITYDIYSTGFSTTSNFFKKGTDNLKISQVIFNNLNNKNNKFTLTIKCCFYKNNLPLDMSTILGDNYYDISICFDEDGAEIGKFYDIDSRKLDYYNSLLK